MFKCSLLHSESITTGISRISEACRPEHKAKAFPEEVEGEERGRAGQGRVM